MPLLWQEHTGDRPVVGGGRRRVGCFWLRLQEFELGLSCRTCIAKGGEWRPRAGLTPTGGATG